MADGFDVKEFRVVSELALARRTLRHAAIRVLLPAALFLLASALPQPVAAQSVKGEVSATVENGFARLVFTLAEDVEPQVQVANGIIVITFERPVDVAVERISANAPGYVSAARRDPDGKGLRIALARKVTVNSMAAAERLFVDLLPDTWTGLPPGLPRDVIEDLARRAREAERKVRQQRVLVRQSKMTPIRVRVASQPTFTRYVFDLPELIGVAANNSKDKLTLTFDALLQFDLADAKATLPPVIGAIDSEIDQDSAVVRFIFAGKVDVRTFREDMSYVVDVTPAEPRSARQDRTVRSDELSATGGGIGGQDEAAARGLRAAANGTGAACCGRAGTDERRAPVPPAPPQSTPQTPARDEAALPAMPARVPPPARQYPPRPPDRRRQRPAQRSI